MENLTNFVTEIADSIRGLKDTTDAIPAMNFADEISSIPKQSQNEIITNQNQVVTVQEGYHKERTVTANITNLSAENIANEVTVGGITGTYKGIACVPTAVTRESVCLDASGETLSIQPPTNRINHINFLYSDAWHGTLYLDVFDYSNFSFFGGRNSEGARDYTSSVVYSKSGSLHYYKMDGIITWDSITTEMRIYFSLNESTGEIIFRYPSYGNYYTAASGFSAWAYSF